MGKPKVKFKAQKDANDRKAKVVHSYNRKIQRLGKPKVKIRTIAKRRVQGFILARENQSSTSGRAHIGGKPKVKIKKVRGLCMGKPKVKMKKIKRKNKCTDKHLD